MHAFVLSLIHSFTLLPFCPDRVDGVAERPHGSSYTGPPRQREPFADHEGGDARGGECVPHVSHPRVHGLRPAYQAVEDAADGPGWRAVRAATGPCSRGRW